MRWLFAYLKALFLSSARPSSSAASQVKQSPKTQTRHPKNQMSEGDIHSGPGGYEGGSYSDGYAADYRNGEN